jgi:hypothetical protein
VSKWAIFFYENARPHCGTANVEAIRQLKFELLLHAPYSPSDYHMFVPLKEALLGRGFASDGKVNRTARD